MPLSDFTWNLQSQPFIHEVYGTKRKAPGFGDAESGMQNDNEEITESTCKRRCVEPSGDSDMTEVNHNMITSQNLNLQSVQPSHTQGCWPSHPSSNGVFINPLVMTTEMQDDDACWPNSNNNHHQVISSDQPTVQPSIQNQQFNEPLCNISEDHMIMNLNDETYSNVNIDLHDEQIVCSSMDSDGFPNPEQYKLEMCDTNSVLCPTCMGRMLGGGETRNPSARVKCYCRPSWEGMMEMRPYVSDYY